VKRLRSPQKGSAEHSLGTAVLCVRTDIYVYTPAVRSKLDNLGRRRFRAFVLMATTNTTDRYLFSISVFGSSDARLAKRPLYRRVIEIGKNLRAVRLVGGEGG